jgi:GNAT superfamily N-acetyltransferase
LKIVPLAEHPDSIPLVAAWGFGEWGHLNPGETLAEREAWMRRETLNSDCAPLTFVALDDEGRAIGTAALLFDDLEGDPRNPWLASVYVPSERRGQGIATALVRTVEDAARRFGYRQLYLFTSTAPGLYAGLGWRALETRRHRGDEIQVMDRAL